MDAVERIEAERACERLILDYAAAIDAGDWEAVAALYVATGRMSRPTAPDDYIEGRDAILASFRARPPRTTRHICANIRVTPDGADRATAQSQIMLFTARDQPPLVGSVGLSQIDDTTASRVWAFLGDGECDEPETLGALSLASREQLDNLVFVVNCNLQRLDGPVRGNGKVIQELEAVFRGAGWNVIKVIWGSRWDPLLANDHTGLLHRVMEECVDGEYQNFKSKGGDYVREHFFGKYPETAAMVANMSDDDIWRLNRGGHDPIKVYAAYANAVNHKGQPSIILAKTVKGYGMGAAGEGQNVAHQQKKLDVDALKEFRDRFNIPVSDKDIESVPYCTPSSASAFNAVIAM